MTVAKFHTATLVRRRHESLRGNGPGNRNSHGYRIGNRSRGEAAVGAAEIGAAAICAAASGARVIEAAAAVGAATPVDADADPDAWLRFGTDARAIGADAAGAGGVRADLAGQQHDHH